MDEPRALSPDAPEMELKTAPMGAAGPISKTNPNHFVTAGEKRFDFRAYTGWGYIANVALSLVAVYFIERTKPGQAAMNWLMKGADKAPSWFGGPARFLASKSFFLTGGFAVLAPIKWMEDRKYEMVKKWNREIYGDRADVDPQILKSEQEIKEAPKQGWASIMSSRILSLIPFYITVGLLWENKSWLGKVTNGAYRDMGKEKQQDFLKDGKLAIKNGDLEGHSKFSQTMGKGIYFDRPIAAVSRFLGKTVARFTGNKAGVARIETMQQQFPGMIKEGNAGTLTRDPDLVAWPYYFICEAITSAIVARAVYLMTRFLGPLIGKKDATVASDSQPVSVNDNIDVANDEQPLAKVKEEPRTKVSAAVIDASKDAAVALAR